MINRPRPQPQTITWDQAVALEPRLAGLEAKAIEAARFGCYGWGDWLKSRGLPGIAGYGSLCPELRNPETRRFLLNHLLRSFHDANPGLGRRVAEEAVCQ
jgi:hypothetical protein